MEHSWNHPHRLKSSLAHGVFWITKRIALGQFATPQRASVLREQDVTHVLNVSEAGSVISAEKFGFVAVRDCPIVDLEAIPEPIVISALDTLHAMLSVTKSRAYVHCIAGQNRSPTIVWLYLVACGVSLDEARQLISDRSPDAVPGHKQLISTPLVEAVISHGRRNYLPLSDPLILEPAY